MIYEAIFLLSVHDFILQYESNTLHWKHWKTCSKNVWIYFQNNFLERLPISWFIIAKVCPFHPNDRVLPHANIHCCIRVRCNGEGGGRWLQCDILRILTLHSHCELRTMEGGECISLDQFSYLNPNTNAHCVCSVCRNCLLSISYNKMPWKYREIQTKSHWIWWWKYSV